MTDDAILNSPSPEAISAGRALVFEAIMEAADLAASHASSLYEAAYRGDERTVEMHLRSLRKCVLAAIADFKDLKNEGGAR